MRKFAIACMAVAAMMVSGCGTMQAYEGPKKPAQEVAVIKSNVGELALDTVWVGRLDGKELVAAYSAIEVPPGPHTAQILIKRGIVTRAETLSFDAKAGHGYRVKGDFSGGRAWVVDESTGQIVAGHE